MMGNTQAPIKEIVQTPGYVTIVMPYGYVRIIPGQPACSHRRGDQAVER